MTEPRFRRNLDSAIRRPGHVDPNSIKITAKSPRIDTAVEGTPSRTAPIVRTSVNARGCPYSSCLNGLKGAQRLNDLNGLNVRTRHAYLSAGNTGSGIRFFTGGKLLR